jgi:hypothetical protein
MDMFLEFWNPKRKPCYQGHGLQNGDNRGVNQA